MKKFLTFLLVFCICLLAVTPGASAASYSPPFDVSAKSVYLVNLDSGMIIYEKNANEALQPGAFAQLMTVILALENVPDLDGTKVTMKNYIQDQMYTKNIELGGIKLAGLYRGEEVSMRNLIYAVSLPAANEAAMMIADYVGDGSIPYFVEMMNKKAQEIGAVNTHFTSPHGLPDPGAYTTAYDMYLIANYARNIPGYMDFVKPTYYDGAPTNIHTAAGSLGWSTNNKLLRSDSAYFNGAVSGIKAGYLSDEGSMVISTAQRNGYTYLMVVMGAKSLDEDGKDTSANAAFAETNKLYNWAFDTFKVKTLLEKGKGFGEVPLKLAWGKDFLRLMSADGFSALIPDEIEASSITFDLKTPALVKAPVKKGDVIGEVNLILAGEVIGTVPLVSAEDVEVSRILLLIDKVVGVTHTFFFKFITIFFIVLVVLYVSLMIVRNRNRRRYRNSRR